MNSEHHPVPSTDSKGEVVAVLQARVSSQRLPGKVLREIVPGCAMLAWQIERLRRCQRINRIVLATSSDPADDALARLAQVQQVDCYRGSLEDVLDRYYQAAAQYQPETVVRVTGDCPWIDPHVVDAVIDLYQAESADYASNVQPPTFPDGLDTEVFRFQALKDSWHEARLPSEREHVTLWMRKFTDLDGGERYHSANYAAPADFSHLRLTVDNPEDLELVRLLADRLGRQASWLDCLAELTRDPQLLTLNRHIVRNEGLSKSLAQDQTHYQEHASEIAGAKANNHSEDS